MGAENGAYPEEPIEISPEMAPKRARTGEAIMCMIEEMRTNFKDGSSMSGCLKHSWRYPSSYGSHGS